MPHATRARIAALTAGCALLAGCSSGAPPGEDAPTPHGYVEGAEETAEAQLRLVMADTETGAVHMLDPVTEETVEVAQFEGAQAMDTDGRFVYIGGASSTEVLDSGVWTVDHGDHVHYYRTEPRTVGGIDGSGFAPIGDPAVTVLNSAAHVIALDRESLEAGEAGASDELDAEAVLPYGRRLLAVDGGAVRVLGRDGSLESELDATCAEPQGQTVTRRGAVFGCRDGAVLITGDDELTAETIPYPGAGVDGGFHHRPGTAAPAARSETGGILVLDIKERRWTEIPVQGVVAVTATGEDSPVLVLTDDGVLRSYDPASGAELARLALMTITDGGTPAIQVDTARAYVNDPAGAAVYEIDYRDDLRLARTFEVDFRPDLMVETGW
ncbi:hypothetical protein [Glycomyces albidus]|uniref:ABC transporter n=1 Tax=Glycomyces albidus TaxID=2656774 RepID=A0A6L5G248_9ACTN|nr:hypothetical protein [Glycomyces albidus]MQM24214.1 hypothetical protein [Glycomyces albidus]